MLQQRAVPVLDLRAVPLLAPLDLWRSLQHHRTMTQRPLRRSNVPAHCLFGRDVQFNPRVHRCRSPVPQWRVSALLPRVGQSRALCIDLANLVSRANRVRVTRSARSDGAPACALIRARVRWPQTVARISRVIAASALFCARVSLTARVITSFTTCTRVKLAN